MNPQIRRSGTLIFAGRFDDVIAQLRRQIAAEQQAQDVCSRATALAERPSS